MATVILTKHTDIMQTKTVSKAIAAAAMMAAATLAPATACGQDAKQLEAKHAATIEKLMKEHGAKVSVQVEKDGMWYFALEQPQPTTVPHVFGIADSTGKVVVPIEYSSISYMPAGGEGRVALALSTLEGQKAVPLWHGATKPCFVAAYENLITQLKSQGDSYSFFEGIVKNDIAKMEKLAKSGKLDKIGEKCLKLCKSPSNTAFYSLDGAKSGGCNSVYPSPLAGYIVVGAHEVPYGLAGRKVGYHLEADGDSTDAALFTADGRAIVEGARQIVLFDSVCYYTKRTGGATRMGAVHLADASQQVPCNFLEVGRSKGRWLIKRSECSPVELYDPAASYAAQWADEGERLFDSGDYTGAIEWYAANGTATPRAKYIAGLALYERANAMVAQAKYVAMLAGEKKYLETYSMPWLDNANLETAKALLTAADKMLNDYLAADATFAKKASTTLQAAQTALAGMDALTAQQEKVEKDRKAWEKEYSKRAITGSSTNTFGSTTFITRQESLISATKRAALSNFKEKYEEKEKLWKKEDKSLVAAAEKLAGVK